MGKKEKFGNHLFHYLGQVIITRDEKKKTPLYLGNGNYLLSFETNLTKSGKTIEVKSVSDRLRKKIKIKSTDTKKELKSIWHEPGIYVFVIKNKLCYIGRASGDLSTRLARYRLGSGKSTSKFVNKKMGQALKNKNNVSIYFLPQKDLEHELQQYYKPPWNGSGVYKYAHEI